MQLSMFTPQAVWRPPAMSSLPSWAEAKRVSIDTETCDPQLKELGIGARRGGYITGISFAIEDGPRHYLPVRHQGGDNLPVAGVFEYLREQAAVFKGDLVGAKMSYDLDYLLNEEVDFKNVRYLRDVLVTDPLLYELHHRYGLDAVAKRHELPGKDEALLREAAASFKVDPKKDMWRLAARYVGPYAEEDAAQPLLISRKQEREIDDREMWDIYNLESQVLPVLVRMRRRGVLIDQDKLEQVEIWSRKQEAEQLEEVFRLTGHRIVLGDVWRAEAFAPALERIGIKVPRTVKGKYSIDKMFLAGVKHPVADCLARARKVNKLRSTFAQSIRNHMVNGRIHCTFNQIAMEEDEDDEGAKSGISGARYGRLSCVDPNLQQQPSRDDFAAFWRSIYIPEPGSHWICGDYSQQEPRWTTHFASVLNLPGARAAAQAYHDDPLLDNHQFMADLTGLPRKYAKNIYLGLCYGEGGAKLSRDCSLPTRWAISMGKGRDRRVVFGATREEMLAIRREHGDGYVYEAAGEEGQLIIDTFDRRAPFIRKLAYEAQSRARERGYIITGGGRHLHFAQKEDGSYDFTHKALNRLIQGTSADQTKMALVALDKESDFYLQLQVHDELDGSVADPKVGLRMAEVMRDVMPARVPFRVDVEIGPNWGDIISYDKFMESYA